jgi:hypothetical protein
VRTTTQMSTYNPNYVGGDIMTGSKDILQLTFGPRITLSPYQVGVPGMYICSAAIAGPRRTRHVWRKRRQGSTFRTQLNANRERSSDSPRPRHLATTARGARQITAARIQLPRPEWPRPVP